jgi:hypothetical protein
MAPPASDFDGAWKEALERFFEPFIAFFFPQVHAGIDWTQPVLFQDTALQQVAPDEPQGKQHVDKLVRVVRRDGTPTWLLIHIEIQSQYDRGFPERMFCYHARIYDRDRRLVVSLAVPADEEPAWRPDQFGYALWGCELALRFPVWYGNCGDRRGPCRGDNPRRSGRGYRTQATSQSLAGELVRRRRLRPSASIT